MRRGDAQTEAEHGSGKVNGIRLAHTHSKVYRVYTKEVYGPRARARTSIYAGKGTCDCVFVFLQVHKYTFCTHIEQ